MGKFRTLEQFIEKKNKAVQDQGSKPLMALGTDIPPTPIIPCFSPGIGYLLDTGGWPEGKLIHIYGQEHVGKTTMALLSAKDCYDYYNGERAILFVDLEHRFNPEWAEKLGIPKESIALITPTDGEEALQLMCGAIDTGEVAAVIYDSIGAAVPGYILEDSYSKATKPGGNTQLIARTIRTMLGLCDNKRTTAFLLNHVQDNMDWHGFKTPGGHAPKHLASISLYLQPGSSKDRKIIKEPEGDFPVGFPVDVKSDKNSFGRAFRQQRIWFFNQPSIYFDGIGYDLDTDYINIGKAVGVVEQAASWFNWHEIRAQGQDGLIKAIRDTGRYDEFKAEVRSIIDSDAVVEQLEETKEAIDATSEV